MVRLIACPACDTHNFANEPECRSCGHALKSPDGSVNRTATAMLLGLTLAAGTATACGDSGTTSSGTGGAGGQAQGTGGMGGGLQTVSAYGVGPSTGGGSQVGSGGSGGSGGAGGQ